MIDVAGLTVRFSREELRKIHSPGLTGQYDREAALKKLLAGTGLAFRFTSTTDVTVDLASVSSMVEVNASVENIGARRLQTVIERVLDDISFSAPDRAGTVVKITAAEVEKNLGDLSRNADLSKFIL